MKPKPGIKKVIKHLPVAKTIINHHNLRNHVKVQQDEITGLREAVDRLDARNLAWEAEVRQMRGEAKTMNVIWPVKPQDLIDADWTKPAKHMAKKSKPPFTINWVVPPMGQVSGGHTDIFRTIGFLESKGHKCRIYFYDAGKSTNLEAIKENLKKFPAVKAELFYDEDDMAECDAIFATNWYTAYPVFNFKGDAKKYYYVQDFEPFFEPVGTYSTLAENTYRFGLRGLTLGSWLSGKLSKEFGMKCDYFELGTNNQEYFLENTAPRKKVLFYARPVTPRRGFELGILSLDLFHKQHPEYEIHFLGWDVTPYNIPFPYVNHGILPPSELNKLYNQCSAGLVLSYTNMSLLPLEMMASGCVPVVNDSPHTRTVGFAKEIKYALSAPQALADALFEVASHKDGVKLSERVSKYSEKFQWNESNDKIEKILRAELS